MTNTMKKPFGMKVKDFRNRLKTLNQFLTLMPHDKDKDLIFSDNDLEALLLKSMSISWQNPYLLEGTQVTDNFCQMLAYFVQFQSNTDSQTMSKSFSTAQELSTTRQYKNTLVLTMDKVVVSLLFFRAVRIIWTVSQEK